MFHFEIHDVFYIKNVHQIKTNHLDVNDETLFEMFLVRHLLAIHNLMNHKRLLHNQTHWNIKFAHILLVKGIKCPSPPSFC